MNKNRDVTIVGLTAVALTFGLPVLDGLANLVCHGINKLVSSWQIDTDVTAAEAQEYVNKMSCDCGQQTHVIGFNTGSEEVDEPECKWKRKK